MIRSDLHKLNTGNAKQLTAVGIPVALIQDDLTAFVTKLASLPWQLGHGQWVAKVEGKTGGFCCSRISPLIETVQSNPMMPQPALQPEPVYTEDTRGNFSFHFENLSPHDAIFLGNIAALFADPAMAAELKGVRAGILSIRYGPRGLLITHAVNTPPSSAKVGRSVPAEPSSH